MEAGYDLQNRIEMFRAGVAALADGGVASGQLSRQAHTHDRAFPAGRQHHHRRAPHRPEADRRLGPAGGGGQSRRRQHHHWFGRHGQSSARWLYAAACDQHACYQSQFAQNALRRGAGFCTCRNDGGHGDAAGGESVIAGEQFTGADCAGQSQAGPSEFCVVGQRHHQPSGD